MKLEKSLPLLSEKLSGLIDAAHIAIGLFFLRLKSLTNPISGDDLFSEATNTWQLVQDIAGKGNVGQALNELSEKLELESVILRGKLFRGYTSTELNDGLLKELIAVIDQVDFQEVPDPLGRIYEYFLGQFAATEGRKGGQFYTPTSIVKLLVRIIAPSEGRLYDPCCGSGGMFVQTETNAIEQNGRIERFGQEINPTTWRLTALNLAMRGYAIDLGSKPANTLKEDLFPESKFDYILANPPFNVPNWNAEGYEQDTRWIFGVPPKNNSNYAWISHIISKLSATGYAGIVLANSVLSGSNKQEIEIRKAMVKNDVIETIVSLPAQMFSNTQIPVCLWILTRNKRRKGEVLCIDARDFGTMISRIQRAFEKADIDKVCSEIQDWRSNSAYMPTAGVTGIASKVSIEDNSYTLTPGRYIETAVTPEQNSTEEFFRLLQQLRSIQSQGAALDKQIARNLSAVERSMKGL